MCLATSSSAVAAGDHTAIDYRELRVFVSSRMAELSGERQAIKAALAKLRVHAWVFEEPDGAGARTQSIQRTYLDELRQADLYIGVFWRGYGEYTEDEYRHAALWNKPCLLYEKRADIEGRRDAALQKLLDEIAAVESGRTIQWFRTPEELATFAERDVARWQAETIRGLRATAVPMQAPPLKPGFVPRPVETGAIRRLLVEPRGDGAATRRVIAVHGLPGSGKSVLAVAVAHDPEVRGAFPAGILWVTLGQAPNIAGVLEGWIRALGSSAFRYTTEEAARAELASLIAARRVLLAIDDAWDPAHVQPLLGGPTPGAVLITTRELVVARLAGAAPEDIVEIGGTSRAQSLAILAGGPERSLPDRDRAAAEQVAEAVGDLPLALSLAASQIADGVSWQELLDDLHGEIARLESLEEPGARDVTDPDLRKRLSLLGSLNLSVGRLAAADRERFAWLGLLPDDIEVTQALAAGLWNADNRTARDGLRYLRGKALLLAGAARPDGTLAYTLHDVVHDLARSLLAEQHGGDLAPAHAAFLDRVAGRLAGGLWHTIPDDGYLHEHLVWHFERAGREHLVHALLSEANAEGGNGWFQVRERMGQVAGYLADVRRGLALACDGRGGEPGPAGCPEQIGYLLLMATFRAFRAPPALALELVRNGLLGSGAARSYALEIPEGERRLRTLVLLAEITSGAARDDLLDRALEAVAELPEDDSGTGAWLAPRLAAAGRLDEALSLAKELSGNQERAVALASLVPYLEGAARSEALERGIEAALSTGEIFAGAAIEALAPHLEEAPLRRLLAEVRQMRNPVWREDCMAILAPRLAELGYEEEAWQRVRSLADRASAAGAIAALAPHLEEPDRSEALQLGIDAVHDLDDDAWREGRSAGLTEFSDLQQSLFRVVFERQSWRAATLAGLAPLLPPAVLEEALEMVEASADPLFRVTGVAALAPALPIARAREAVDAAWLAARAIEAPAGRAEALTALLPRVEEAKRPAAARELLAAIGAVDRGFESNERLSEAAPELPAEVLGEALDLVSQFDVGDRDQAVEALAPRLDTPGLLRAYALSRAIQDGDAVRLASAALAARLDEQARVEGLSQAAGIGNPHLRARAIELLAPGLPASAIPRALGMARELDDKSGTSQLEVALPAIARRLAGAERRALVNEIVGAITQMTDGERAAWAVERIGDLLEPADHERLLAAAPAIAAHSSEDLVDYERARLEVALLPGLPAPAREAVLEGVLAAISRMEDARDRRPILALAAEGAPGSAFPRAVELAQAIPEAGDRALTLALLVPHAPEPERLPMIGSIGEALATMDATDDDAREQIDLISARVVAHVPPGYMLQLLEDMASDAARRIGVIEAAPHLSRGDFERALAVARRIAANDDRAQALSALATAAEPDRVPALLEEALEAALAANTDLHHDDTLAPLAARIAALEAPQAAALWRKATATLESLPRPELAAKLRALAPVIERAGGASLLREAIAALERVSRWFP